MFAWQFYPGKVHETLAKFAELAPEQEQALISKVVKLIGPWQDINCGRGLCIVKSKSGEAVSRYSLNRNVVMDLETSIVLDDTEARALGKSLK